MQKYIYRNKENQFYHYYLDNGNLIEHELFTQSNTHRALAKCFNQNFSVTFSKAERPNIFFLDRDNKLCISKYMDNIWVQETLHTLDLKPEFFKVLEFQDNYALIYCVKTSESRVFDTYFMYIGEKPTSPKFLAKIYSQTSNAFSVEEISLNHYAILYKTFEGRKANLSYMEITSNRQSNPVVIASNELNIEDETFLFDEYAYCLYTKKRNYSQQLCLKVISNFNDIPEKEYLVFEGKNISNSNIYIANNKLHIHFVAGKNTMTRVSDDLQNIGFGKLVSEYENGTSLEKAKFIGFSLNSDNFRANNLYLNSHKQFAVLNKYCNFPSINFKSLRDVNHSSNTLKLPNNDVSQYELRNQALLEENRSLKKQLRKYED